MQRPAARAGSDDVESTVQRRPLVATLFSISLAVSLAAAGCSSDDGGSGSDDQTLTYWASNQGTSLENDEEILAPELEKFTKQTGIEVELEVISWDNLLNRILAATTSGDAPDVLNIGNTWSASLQATGAFVPFDDAAYEQIGGKDKFLATSLTSTGAEGETPTSVPLYGLAYGLFYNKQVFADAGIKSPPTTWEELVQAGEQITDPGSDVWGMTIAGASYTESVHFAFMFGRQQGTDFFDDEGEADFTLRRGRRRRPAVRRPHRRRGDRQPERRAERHHPGGGRRLHLGRGRDDHGAEQHRGHDPVQRHEARRVRRRPDPVPRLDAAGG